TDLGLRAREAGAELVYADGALVWHAVLPRPLRRALREAGRRDATAAVIARHPSHRDELYGRYFAHARHARLLLAVLGGLAARRRPWLAAAGLLLYLEGTLDRSHMGPR